MLEKIMNLVKDQVTDTISGVAGIPEDKKEAAVETTTSSLIDGLKSYATPENIASFTSMLGMGKSGGGMMPGVSSGLESNIVSSLTSKVGLNPSVAQSIASMVIPAVMSLFRKKVDDSKDPGFNLDSLIGAFSGKSSASSSGGIMEMVGSIFGKK